MVTFEGSASRCKRQRAPKQVKNTSLFWTWLFWLNFWQIFEEIWKFFDQFIWSHCMVRPKALLI